MAFSAAGFSRIGHGNGQTLYMYKSTDAIATQVASGYFNSVYTELRKGDVILCVDVTTPKIMPVMVSSADGAATVTTLGIDIGT